MVYQGVLIPVFFCFSIVFLLILSRYSVFLCENCEDGPRVASSRFCKKELYPYGYPLLYEAANLLIGVLFYARGGGVSRWIWFFFHAFVFTYTVYPDHH